MGKRLYVGNLPFNTSPERLQDFFEETLGFGKVKQVKMITDRDTGRPRGFAFVELADDVDHIKAIEDLNGVDFDGRTLKVNEAQERAPNGGGRARFIPRSRTRY